MPKTYNKLVRDGIPGKLDGLGVTYEKRIADDREYQLELERKLFEETQEFLERNSVEELADIIEVVEALKKLPAYADVENVRKEKLKKLGGFEQKIILKGEDDR